MSKKKDYWENVDNYLKISSQAQRDCKLLSDTRMMILTRFLILKQKLQRLTNISSYQNNKNNYQSKEYKNLKLN
mgnify:CR=1 FL=1